MVFDPLYLRHLIEIVGADRVMVGTDFPFDMARTTLSAWSTPSTA